MLKLFRPSLRRGPSLSQIANMSSKSSVLLRNLPVTATLESLKSAVGNLEVKNIQLQPGCSFHFFSANDAQSVANCFSGKMNFQADIVNSSMPCLDVDREYYEQHFSKFIENNDEKPISVFKDDTSSKYKLPFAHLLMAKKIAKAASIHANVTNDILHISSLQTYVVQISGVESNTPVSSLLNILGKDLKPFNVERTALISFKRSQHVIPGIKQLKKIQLDGENIKVHRFAPLLPSNTRVQVDFHAAFDQFSNQQFLQDNLSSDPATRFQIVKNSFDLCLNDAMAKRDICHLLPSNSPLYSEAQSVLDKLLLKPNKDSVEKLQQQLFEIFLQRDDIAKFSHDFNEIAAVLGPIDQSDNFNWSQFRMETNEDVERLYVKAVELGEKAAEKNVNAVLGENIEKQIANSSEAKKTTLLNPSILRDADGRMWSGVILDTDMVQKTMPGNRVGTHRALVVVGNLRGSAGYGMGKGKTTGDALNSAFRAAQRNLLHVDLYENFGLAHDVHGKHNSCHAYIRATPRSRKMVASPFASAILQRFGIGSASVKLVGRRDPYAMVRAIFDALSRHQNIDEYAKARGKRYLTQKWAHDNGL